MQRDQINLNVGVDLDSYTPHFRVQSIAIDNRTGSWLHVEGLDQFVPPYTIGWVRNYEWTTGSVTVRFVNGPSGSSSVESGDGAIIWLHDAKTAQSDGVQYYSARQPQITNIAYQSGAIPPIGQDISIVLPATIGFNPVKQHMRLYGAIAGLTASTIKGRIYTDISVYDANSGNTNTLLTLATLWVNSNHPFDTIWFPQPIDLPLGYLPKLVNNNRDLVDTLVAQTRLIYGII